VKSRRLNYTSNLARNNIEFIEYKQSVNKRESKIVSSRRDGANYFLYMRYFVLSWIKRGKFNTPFYAVRRYNVSKFVKNYNKHLSKWFTVIPRRKRRWKAESLEIFGLAVRTARLIFRDIRSWSNLKLAKTVWRILIWWEAAVAYKGAMVDCRIKALRGTDRGV
jgi:hypothetical protein